MSAVISPVRNIQKYIKENLLKLMSLVRQITSSKEKTGKIKSSLELILLIDSDRRQQCSEVSVQTTVPEVKRKKDRPHPSSQSRGGEETKKRLCYLSPKGRTDEPKQPTARTAVTWKWL